MINLQHLPNARPGEKIQVFLRRHWSTPLEIIFYGGLLYAIPAIGAWYFWDNLLEYLTDQYLGPIIILATSAYVMTIWLFTFLEFTDYYLDVWIVTNERIINIEQKGLFTRVASELHLSSIEDATSEVKGMFRTFLDFGNVFIQTAGEKTRFVFKNVPHPERVKETIIELINNYRLRREQFVARTAVEAIKK
jgi:hypothetical protein